MVNLTAMPSMSFTQALSANTGADYLDAVALMVIVFAAVFIIKQVVHTVYRSKRQARGGRKLVKEFLDQLKWPLYAIIAVYVGSMSLELPSILDWALFIIFLSAILVYIVKGTFGIVDFFVEQKQKHRKGKEEFDTSFLVIIKALLKGTAVVLAVLLLLSNMGLNVTSLIAGLGIGGIAIAFAFQNILEDIFSSLSIYLDKPFKEGDFIIIGNDMGVVKHVGIKSTRVQALGGQELIVSNRELTSTRVNNYKRMEKRRIVFTFGVTYETPLSKVKKIPDVVREVVTSTQNTEFDRAHFKSFGDSALLFEVVYYVTSPDYTVYMDAQQQINLGIAERLKKQKVSFAYPTQTVYEYRMPYGK